jgi:hypothetical protein
MEGLEVEAEYRNSDCSSHSRLQERASREIHVRLQQVETSTWSDKWQRHLPGTAYPTNSKTTYTIRGRVSNAGVERALWCYPLEIFSASKQRDSPLHH